MKSRYGKNRPFGISFAKRFITLIKHPLFWALTIAGNTLIVIGALVLKTLESTVEKPVDFVDCLLWSTGIVTTIGYTNYIPHTFLGKLTVICLMLLGTFFLWSYMAFLVSGLISPALSSLEKELQDVERELTELKIEEHKALAKEQL